MIDYGEISAKLGGLEEEAVIRAAGQVIAEGGDASKALEACRQGLEIVGAKFESGEYFIGDLIFAGEIMSEAMGILKPALVEGGGKSAGKVVIGTVEGDIHDIGKNIVISLLEAGGLEVIDLGVDASPAKFVSAVRESGAGIVALSCVLTLGINAMARTVAALKEAGLRENVKVIIGGAPVTAKVCEITGADFWTLNPQESLRKCLEWAKEQAGI